MLLLLTLTTTKLSPLDDSDIRAGATGFNQTKTALTAITTANISDTRLVATNGPRR